VTTTSGRFLAISDIHFDPFDGKTDPNSQLAQDLLQLPASDWPAYFDKLDLTPTLPGQRLDANYALMQETLDHAASVAADVDFIVYPGDFMRHDLWHSWGAAEQNGIDQQDLPQFFKKMVEVVLNAITTRFPNTPLLMTFGNDDSYTADYALDSAFLADMATLCPPVFGDAVDQVGLSEFASTGCYTATLPGSATTLISLANVSWSTRGNNSVQGAAVLNYLNDQLEALPAGSHVWLMMHVPPGDSCFIDRSHTLQQSPNWQAPYNVAFQRAIDDHDVTIDIVFTGHTHMDDFRFGTNQRAHGKDVVMYKIVPAVSPKFGQNPCFQVYNAPNGVITDWTTHYRESHPDAAGNHWPAPSSARADYQFTDPAQLLERFRSMLRVPAAGPHLQRDVYASDYKVHRHPLHAQVDSYVRNAIALATNYLGPETQPSDESIEEVIPEEAVFYDAVMAG